MPSGTRKSRSKQLEDLKRRMKKKPMGKGPSRLKPSTKQPPKSKTPRKLPDVVIAINEKRKTGGVERPGGFRKPTFNPKTMKPKGRR